MLSSFVKRFFSRRRAPRGAGRTASAELARARALQAQGDLAGARAICEGILAQDRDCAEAHFVLGMACGAAGEIDRAFEHLGAAARLDPDSQEAHFGLGNVHWMRRDVTGAVASYERALALDPSSAQAHFSLGMVLRFAQRAEEAARHFERAVALAPEFGESVRQWVLALLELGRFDEALAAARAAVERSPSDGGLRSALGLVHQKMHRPQAALECFDEAAARGRDDAELWLSRGYVLQELGRIPEAVDAYGGAIAREPGHTVARFHRALARLVVGDYAAGWPEYETRLASLEHPRRTRTWPRWDGSPLAGRTLLVYGEQGLGDELMFASCLPEVIGAAGRCVIECNPKLERLFRRSFPSAEVYAAGSARPGGTGAEAIDLEVPIGSLPLYLRGSAAAFPAHRGYLSADPARIGAWRQRLEALGRGLKIGISWRGGTHVSRSPLRSIPLAQWLPIFAAAEARFVSLQYGDCRGDLDGLAAQHGVSVAHWPEAIDDYDETAALVCALDLVISVCTAVIHLGGALGRRVWIMTPYSPEWRYGAAGDGMPWYPSVRLFRQRTFGEWPPVIDAVARELNALGGVPPG